MHRYDRVPSWGSKCHNPLWWLHIHIWQCKNMRCEMSSSFKLVEYTDMTVYHHEGPSVIIVYGDCIYRYDNPPVRGAKCHNPWWWLHTHKWQTTTMRHQSCLSFMVAAYTDITVYQPVALSVTMIYGDFMHTSMRRKVSQSLMVDACSYLTAHQHEVQSVTILYSCCTHRHGSTPQWAAKCHILLLRLDMQIPQLTHDVTPSVTFRCKVWIHKHHSTPYWGLTCRFHILQWCLNTQTKHHSAPTMWCQVLYYFIVPGHTNTTKHTLVKCHILIWHLCTKTTPFSMISYQV